MSNRNYPCIGSTSKIKEPFTCGTCKKEFTEGKRIDVQTCWFRGDDDVHKLCFDCAILLKNEIKEIHEEKARKQEEWYKRNKPRLDREDAAREAKKKSLMDFLNANYTIKVFTEHQFRVNGVLDIYPTNRRYHDIKNNKRGGYNDTKKFIINFFKNG